MLRILLCFDCLIVFILEIPYKFQDKHAFHFPFRHRLMEVIETYIHWHVPRILFNILSFPARCPLASLFNYQFDICQHNIKLMWRSITLYSSGVIWLIYLVFPNQYASQFSPDLRNYSSIYICYWHRVSIVPILPAILHAILSVCQLVLFPWNPRTPPASCIQPIIPQSTTAFLSSSILGQFSRFRL